MGAMVYFWYRRSFACFNVCCLGCDPDTTKIFYVSVWEAELLVVSMGQRILDGTVVRRLQGFFSGACWQYVLHVVGQGLYSWCGR